MLRRSISQFAARSSVSRVPLTTKTQIPSYLSSRRAFSVSRKNGPQKPDSGNNGPQKLDTGSNAPEPQSLAPKFLIGGIALGSALLGAYYYGAIDEYVGKQQQSIREYTNAGISDKKASVEQKDAYNQDSELSKRIAGNSSGESGVSSPSNDHAKQDTETQSKPPVLEDSISTESLQEKDITVEAPENVGHVEGIDIPSVPQNNISSDDKTIKPAEESFDLKGPGVEADTQQHKAIETTQDFTGKPAEESFDLTGSGVEADVQQHKAIETTQAVTSADSTSSAENETEPVQREQATTPDMQEVAKDGGTQDSNSLLGDYYLNENSEEFAASSSNNHEILKDATIEDAHDGYITKDGKLVLDFLQAIHAAEERQAEMDARSFTEEKRAMKEKYEKELKDARVRELMYAEREAILDKELIKERVKAAAALKSLQEKLEEELKTELEQKQMEVEQRLKEMQDIAKAELAAAIASEKASQIEKMAEANLHINALCMAFYARSEEARQSHSVHKLALGALALEDALSKGLPIEKEIETVRDHLEGVDKDSLIALVLSSLPEDTQKYGTDTLSQLNHKFDAMKGTVRHFSLIPPSGGGILSHSLARVASLLKVKETDQSGEGVESLINRVESLLAQGKLCEAADTLENGVRGTQAAEVVTDWVRRARNRAVTEQALTILQSYATSVSLT